MHHEHADRDRHLAFVNQLVEDGRRAELNAVLVDVHAGGLGRIVLLGDIHPKLALRAGEDLAVLEGVFGNFTLGNFVGGHTISKPRIREAKSQTDRGKDRRRAANHGKLLGVGGGGGTAGDYRMPAARIRRSRPETGYGRWARRSRTRARAGQSFADDAEKLDVLEAGEFVVNRSGAPSALAGR